MVALAIRLGILVLFLAALTGSFVTSPDYSVFAHTISELAGQDMPHAWIMRTGLAAYGAAVVIAGIPGLTARPLHRLPILAFGLSMAGTALWAARPIWPDAPFDVGEDWWHSVFSSTAGMSFSLACAARLFLPGGSPRDVLSWTGLVASVAIPLLMFRFPDHDGLPQRLMFAISAVWFWREFPRR